MPFPPLPDRFPPWPMSVIIAAAQVYNAYATTTRVVESGNYNRNRLSSHKTLIDRQVRPLLQSITKQEPFLQEWAATVTVIMRNLSNELENMEQDALNTESGSVSIPANPVISVYTGRPGRPAKRITREALEWASMCNLKLNQIASLFGVHRNHLRLQMKAAGLSTSRYSDISDQALDDIVREAMASRPDTGIAYLTGHLRAHHKLRIQRSRIRTVVQNVDNLAAALRQQAASSKPRGKYRISRPHALWHIDGHHKLIKWGIVIHGVIDGYSRKITGLRANISNTAESVLDMFIDSISEHGVPSRVRGDRGGENRDVSILMIKFRGRHRGSFMWGSSVHNTPIERLWVEVGRRFCRAWRAFFIRLGRLHSLNKDDPLHRWLLSYLFLDAINQDCNDFVAEWNAHPMQRRGYKSPNDLEIEGMIKFGVYNPVTQAFSFKDECEGLSEEAIEQYYTEGSREEGGSGDEAEESDDEGDFSADVNDGRQEEGSEGGLDFDDENDVDGSEDEGGYEPRDGRNNDDDENDDEDSGDSDLHEVKPAEDVDPNIRHEAIYVPQGNCPFDEAGLRSLRRCIDTVQSQGHLPDGYGVLPEEWEDNMYPEYEHMPIGQSRKSKLIHLPNHIWLSRSELWAQALCLIDSANVVS